MSRAFVKESEGEWLGDVAPTLEALERFLSRELGAPVNLVRTFEHDGNAAYELSNGSCYQLDEDRRWRMIL